MGGHQQHGIRADRAGRKGHRARRIARRRIGEIPGRNAVNVDDLSATAPLEQHVGDPGFLLQARIAHFERSGLSDWVELPEHAPPTPVRQIIEIVERDARESARHVIPCDQKPGGPPMRAACGRAAAVQPACSPALRHIVPIGKSSRPRLIGRSYPSFRQQSSALLYDAHLRLRPLFHLKLRPEQRVGRRPGRVDRPGGRRPRLPGARGRGRDGGDKLVDVCFRRVEGRHPANDAAVLRKLRPHLDAPFPQ